MQIKGMDLPQGRRRNDSNIEIPSSPLCSLRSFAAKEVPGFPCFATKERKERIEKRGHLAPFSPGVFWQNQLQQNHFLDLDSMILLQMILPSFLFIR